MSLRKKLSAAAITVTLSTLGAVAVASPASAASAYGCNWPRVCFYLTTSSWNNSAPTAAFQDVTSSYQNLGSRSRGSYAVYNSRNDDGALLRFTNGSTFCVWPNEAWGLQGIGTVDGIRIMDSEHC